MDDLGTNSEDYDWITEANTRTKANGQPKRDYDKGWWYVRNGQLHFTKGQTGHFIYQKLMVAVQENIEDWISEYLESKQE